MEPFDHLRNAIEDGLEELRLPHDYPPEKRALATSFERWAAGVYGSGSSLRSDTRISQLQLGPHSIPVPPDQVASFAQNDLIRPELEALLLQEGGDMVQRSFGRLLELLPVLVASPLNEFADRYLSHVARLYVWGFDQEVHALCRTVLDAVLQDLLPTDAVKRAIGTRKNYVTLNDRVQLGRFTDPVLYDVAGWELAFYIKEDGNNVLHDDIRHNLHFKSSLEAIVALTRLLRLLPPPGTRVRIRAIPPNAKSRPTTKRSN